MLVLVTTPTDSRSDAILELKKLGKIKKELHIYDFREDMGMELLESYPEFGPGTVIDTETGQEFPLKELI